MGYHSNEIVIWNTLMDYIGNPYGVAGIMGNLYAESALNPKNLQKSFEKKLGMTDEEYTNMIDRGAYKQFEMDGAGYGLAQWTYSGRKRNLLEFAKERGVSIGDLDMQLAFLLKELEKYDIVMETIRTCSDVEAASDIVMLRYEMPANRSEEERLKRKVYGETYLAAYSKRYVRVTGNSVNVRSGDCTDYKSLFVAKKADIFEYAGTSLDEKWVAIRVKEPNCEPCVAWISAKYVEEFSG